MSKYTSLNYILTFCLQKRSHCHLKGNLNSILLSNLRSKIPSPFSLIVLKFQLLKTLKKNKHPVLLKQLQLVCKTIWKQRQLLGSLLTSSDLKACFVCVYFKNLEEKQQLFSLKLIVKAPLKDKQTNIVQLASLIHLLRDKRVTATTE